MKKILITGGAGFIGTHLVEKLMTNYEITIFDNFRRDSLQYTPHLKSKENINIVHGDVLDKDALIDAVKDVEIVLHMAAIAGVSSYYNSPLRTLQVNLIGTYNLLEACKDSQVKKIIDVSTSEVYGPDAFDVSEYNYHTIGPVNDFRWTYSLSKLASENLTLRYGDAHDFKVFTVRPFNIYGPRQTGEGAISNFMKAVATDQPITIYGDGNPIRSWCYISDFIDAMTTLIDSDDIESDTFNIGNPKETYTTLGLARMILQAADKKVPITYQNMSRTEIKVRVPNIDKARSILKYEPRIDLEEGLRLTYEWFKEN